MTHSERVTYHANRAARLTNQQAIFAFFHFLGALEELCKPKSPINRGPSREALVLALERAVNSQTGT